MRDVGPDRPTRHPGAGGTRPGHVQRAERGVAHEPAAQLRIAAPVVLVDRVRADRVVTRSDRDVRRETVVAPVSRELRADVRASPVRVDGLVGAAVDVDVHLDGARDVRVECPTVHADHSRSTYRPVETPDRVARRSRRGVTVHEHLGHPHLAGAVGDTDADVVEPLVEHVREVSRRCDEGGLQRGDARTASDVLTELAPSDVDPVGQVGVAEAPRRRHVGGPRLGLRGEHRVHLHCAGPLAGSQCVDLVHEIRLRGGV